MIDQKNIAVIGACTPDGSYGLGNGMPWPHISEDMKRFKDITSFVPSSRYRNALGCGIATFDTMKNLDLGSNRLLFGVSRRNHSRVENYNQRTVKSFEKLLHLTPHLIHRLFFIGGEAAWEFGFKFAGVAYITIIHTVCTDSGVKKLKKPLQEMAKDSGMKLVPNLRIGDRNRIIEGPITVEFQQWRK